jgi:glycosyltransferase involved in cell wall biosynthesis
VNLAESHDRPTTSRPRVTIGVPVYNGVRFLDRALESLLAQTYQDLEIVISDNASTDGTPAVIARWAEQDPRIRTSRNDVNKGLIWNHRRTLALARGEYFMFASHDDWFAPTYVERCVEVLGRRPEVALVYAETVLVDEDGRETGRDIARQRLEDPSPSTRFWDILVVQGGLNHYGMTRRRLLGSIHPYKPLPRAERILFAELALWGPFHLLREDLYFRRIHGEQMTVLRTNRKAETLALDPSRSGGLRNSVPVLLAEYVLAYVTAVLRAPISLVEKAKGLGRIGRWILAHMPGFRLTDPRTRAVDIRQTGEGALPRGRAEIAAARGGRCRRSASPRPVG